MTVLGFGNANCGGENAYYKKGLSVSRLEEFLDIGAFVPASKEQVLILMIWERI